MVFVCCTSSHISTSQLQLLYLNYLLINIDEIYIPDQTIGFIYSKLVQINYRTAARSKIFGRGQYWRMYCHSPKSSLLLFCASL